MHSVTQSSVNSSNDTVKLPPSSYFPLQYFVMLPRLSFRVLLGFLVQEHKPQLSKIEFLKWSYYANVVYCYKRPRDSCKSTSLKFFFDLHARMSLSFLRQTWICRVHNTGQCMRFRLCGSLRVLSQPS